MLGFGCSFVIDGYDDFMDDIVIQVAGQGDGEMLRQISCDMGTEKPLHYFEIGLERQAKGKSFTFVMSVGGQVIGYCLLNLAPKYKPYARLEIPEIQDLNVLPDYRRRGFGRQIITHCESVARERGFEQIGISFGLDSSYGAAQRLYVQMGYVPDGLGVTYDREFVRAGDIRAVDDDLCLMLIKDLAKTAA